MKSQNIFFSPFALEHGAVPFDRITVDQYEQAIESAIKEQETEIESIISNSAEPDFENTIVALERSGASLSRVLGVFYPMLSAEAHDELMELANRVSPRLTEHNNNIMLNRALWQRVDNVNTHFNAAEHTPEDRMLMHDTHEAFRRCGAALDDKGRELYRQLSKRLTELSLKHEQNCLKEKAIHKLWLTDADLDGLPETAIEAARQDAAEAGEEGKYLITLYAPSYMPFMKYSSRRDLRKALYLMNASQCSKGDYSNIEIVREIANIRLELARLLGYDNYAQYRLERTMAGDITSVYSMLDRLRDAYLPAQRREMRRLEEFATRLEGETVKIEPWDYAYYSNKERESLFQLNDELLRPYFELNRVMNGIFALATKLYGIHFTPNTSLPVYHPDVQVHDVTDNDGHFVGLLYTDFFPRATKQSGAWMTNFREQWTKDDGRDVRPLVTLTMNFTKPTATKPSLLTFSEVRTFMHEFGHALHSLLTRCRYASMSGTNVDRDFVELPSQFNENFLTEREFLDSFARHYLTGEPIPQELVDKVIASSQYGAGYACVRQLGFGYLDMAWHTITEPVTEGVFDFERKATHSVKVFDEPDGCGISPHFGHIFSGGYAAGYYGYKWAEVLDADAFEKFKEDGIFNEETARSFQDNILSRGGTEPPMTLYKRFRGREPQINALMKRDGIQP